MGNALIDSVAGFVLLAIVVTVLGYMVPTAIRSRQVVADARIDDRFSTGLRVLARAGDAPAQYDSTARVYLHTPRDGHVEDPMERQSIPPASDAPAAGAPAAGVRAADGAATGVPDRDSGASREVTAASRSAAHDAAPGATGATDAGGTAAGAISHRVGDRSAAAARRSAALRAARAAAASRRAAAARRRLVLLTVLTAATATLWVLFATIGLTMIPAIGSSVLLVAATVAGRRAAVHAARAAARDLEAAGRAGPRRRSTDREAAAGEHHGQPDRGGNDETTTAQHTGQMRHARRRTAQGGKGTDAGADHPAAAHSGAETTDRGVDGAAGSAVHPDHTAPSAREGAGQQGPERTPIAERTGSLRISVDPAGTEGGGSEGAEAAEDGWTPVPVPKPTYTLKASAPRRSVPAYRAPQWEVAPAPLEPEAERQVTLAEVEQAVRERLDPQAPPATEEQVLAEQETAAGQEYAAGRAAPRVAAGASDAATAASPSGPPAEPDHPKMDLQSVLERRRAVGQ